MKRTSLLILAIVSALLVTLCTGLAVNADGETEITNIAAGRTFDVVPGFSSQLSNLTDGNRSTSAGCGWTLNTAAEGDDAAKKIYATLDFGEKWVVSGASVTTGFPYATVKSYSWEVYTSLDNTTWTQAGVRGLTPHTAGTEVRINFEEVTARYVRIYFTKAPAGNGRQVDIAELSVYGRAYVIAIPEGTVNIAGGKTVTVAPGFSGATSLVVDGNASTYAWTTGATATSEENREIYAIVDLGEGYTDYQVVQASVTTGYVYTPAKSYAWEVWTSVDGNNWTLSAERMIKVQNGKEEYKATLEKFVTARYVKICFIYTTAGDGTQVDLAEIGVYAASTHTHSYTLTNTTPATCTAAGLKTFTCSACGDVITEPISALGHNYLPSGHELPTFEEDGYVIYTCTRCADSYHGDITPAITDVIGTTAEEKDGQTVSAVGYVPDATGRDITVMGCAGTNTIFVAPQILENLFAADSLTLEFTNGVTYTLDSTALSSLSGEEEGIVFAAVGVPYSSVEENLSAMNRRLLGSVSEYFNGYGFDVLDSNGNKVVFNGNVEITLELANAMPSGVDPVVYYYNNGSISKVDGIVYDADNNTITFGVTHFSEYIVIPELIAVVDNVAYYDIDSALEAADGSLEKPVILIADMDYNITDVNSFTTVALALDAVGHTVTFANGILLYQTTVAYDDDNDGTATDYVAYALYDKDYLLGEIATGISNAGIENISAVYNGTSINLVATNIQGISDFVNVITLNSMYDIIGQFAPLAILADGITVDGFTLFDGEIKISAIYDLLDANDITLESIATATSKTLVSYELVISDNNYTYPVELNFVLDCTDDEFGKFKDTADSMSHFIEYSFASQKLTVTAEARALYMNMFAQNIESLSLKEVRDEINAMSIKEFMEGLGDTELLGEYAKYQSGLDAAVSLISRVLAKRSPEVLNRTVGSLDDDGDGTYSDTFSLTITSQQLIEKIEKIVLEKLDERYAALIDVDDLIGQQSLSMSFNFTVHVFDKVTVTFVDENSNLLYTAVILEGDAPVFGGTAPTKPATTELIFTFSGWNDGSETFAKDALPEVLENTTFTVVFTETETASENDELKYEMASVLFETSFSVKYYVKKALLENYDSFWTVVNFNGSEYTINGTENGEYYQFVFDNIAAKEVGDEMTVKLYATYELDGTTVTEHSEELVYSVKTYAYNRLRATDSDDFKTLLVDALTYSTYAQLYFDYNTENLTIADLTPEELACGTTEVPELTSSFAYTERDGETVVFDSASVVFGLTVNTKFILNLEAFEGNIEDIRLKFTYADPSTGEQTETVATGSELVANGNYYTYEFKELPIRSLRTVITAQVFEVDNTPLSGILEYSVETYVYNKYQSGSAVSGLGVAAIKYADSANTYWGTVKSEGK